MKSLKELLPRASQSFIAANPHLAGQNQQQNDSSAILSAANANRGASMNATERSYALLLEALKRNDEIHDWKFESVKLRISTRCHYTPDFLVERKNGRPFFVEVKGPFIREDARVKFLAAKELHTWADFEMHQRDRNHGWQRIL